MNKSLINCVATRLRNLANTPNVLARPIDAVTAVNIGKDISSIAESVILSDPSMHRMLSVANGNLFGSNQLGQAFINPFAVGEVIFALDYLAASKSSDGVSHNENDFMWSCIHPSIIEASKRLYEDGHYAEAAVNAFIELNDHAKKLYKTACPDSAEVPDGTDLMNKLLSPKNPIIQVHCAAQDSEQDFQRGIHMLAAGAMAALRNPKAHSNDEVLTAQESMQRLMLASLLMAQLDESSSSASE